MDRKAEREAIMTRKVFFLTVTLSVFFIFAWTALSLAAINGSGSSIMLVDSGDADTTVTVNITDMGSSDSLFFRTDGGGWNLVSFANSSAILNPFPGGTLMDFGVDINGGGMGSGDLFSYNGADASLLYDNALEDYYKIVTISWTGLSPFKIDVLSAAGPNVDGFKPVPIPSALWLIGSGLIALVGIRSRRKNLLPPR